jgi:peptidoglycan/LPS O-acetylase OafA/YrhL
MSFRYETVRLLLRLGVGLGVALLFAALIAVLHGSGYGRSLELCCYLVGALMLVLAAAGTSPGRGYGLDVESALAGSSRWRTVIGEPANSPSKTLAPAVPFLFAGSVLIVVGVALSYVG